jgi:hypothetical protein
MNINELSTMAEIDLLFGTVCSTNLRVQLRLKRTLKLRVLRMWPSGDARMLNLEGFSDPLYRNVTHKWDVKGRVSHGGFRRWPVASTAIPCASSPCERNGTPRISRTVYSFPVAAPCGSVHTCQPRYRAGSCGAEMRAG